jgi:hypothetical protein
MLTTFYCKEVPVRFNTYLSDCTSTCGNFLWRKEVDLSYDVILDNTGFLSNHAGQRLSMITTTSGAIPTYSTLNTHYAVPYAWNSTEQRSCFSLSVGCRSNAKTSNWVTKGFTAGTLSTFKSEIANYFYSVKGLTNHAGGWGDDKGINIILLIITFGDDVGSTYYQPLFYHGNSGDVISTGNYSNENFDSTATWTNSGTTYGTWTVGLAANSPTSGVASSVTGQGGHLITPITTNLMYMISSPTLTSTRNFHKSVNYKTGSVSFYYYCESGASDVCGYVQINGVVFPLYNDYSDSWKFYSKPIASSTSELYFGIGYGSPSHEQLILDNISIPIP